MEKPDKLQIHFVTRAEGGILKDLKTMLTACHPFSGKILLRSASLRSLGHHMYLA